MNPYFQESTFTSLSFLHARTVRNQIRISLVLIVISAALVILNSREAQSLPQFAVMNGERCISCHVNVHGGGLRTSRGYYEMIGNALITPEKVRLGKVPVINRDTNSLFDGRLSYGSDVRIQMARSPVSPDAKRRRFTMQETFYGSLAPVKWLRAEVSHDGARNRLDGSEKWTASAILRPWDSVTQLRVGMFQPAIGMRFDDHTVLVREVPGSLGGASLIAPDYAEYGAEAVWGATEHVTFTAGVHRAYKLAKNRLENAQGNIRSLIKDRDTPSFLGRVEYQGELPKGVGTLLTGCSVFENGDFIQTNLFAGTGFVRKAAVIGEYAVSDTRDLRHIQAGTILCSYRVLKPIEVYLRGERGTTRFSGAGGTVNTYTNQAVAGIQLFLLPWVELRPEYRIVDTNTFRARRWAAQLHLMY
jgi:hypothetical protein